MASILDWSNSKGGWSGFEDLESNWAEKIRFQNTRFLASFYMKGYPCMVIVASIIKVCDELTVPIEPGL